MKNRLFCFLTAILAVISCKPDKVSPAPYMTFPAGQEMTFSWDNPKPQTLKIRTNVSWKAECEADWISVTPVSGSTDGVSKVFDITVTAASNSGKDLRKTEIVINYGKLSKTVKVLQSADGVSLLHLSSDPSIPQDMIFSTTLGRNTTNVAQGFDYDPVDDMIYITQKYGTYRNHIGWQKREVKSSATVAPNFMTLSCFSHGNNIWVERESSGKKYVWAPNYGTRQDDGSYDRPKVISRFPLESGVTLKNTETTENYYFGQDVTWPAFDFANDMIAICNYKYFYIYKLSEVMALPVTDVQLDYSITYGGVVGSVDPKIPEYTGKPIIKARNCTSLKPLYTVQFDYSARKLHWQSYCIDNGWIYAILQADKKSAPDIIFDTYVEAYKMDGSKRVLSVRQEYMQNRERLLQFDWTDTDNFYCEPEGIKVMGDTMLLMYTIKGNDSHPVRRPVIFKLANPAL